MYKHYNFMVRWNKKSKLQETPKLYKFVTPKDSYKIFFCPTIDKQKSDTATLNDYQNNINNYSLDNLKNIVYHIKKINEQIPNFEEV